MAYDRFLIAPINTGLQTDLKPWLIAEDAFTTLTNAYVFRGRVRKRFGSIYMAQRPLSSRLGVLLGTTNGAGNLAGTVPGTLDPTRFGQAFSIGTEIYTVQATGTPVVMLDTGLTTTKTFNTTTGAYVFAGAPINTNVFYYPALPVMGIANYELGPINNQPSFAWDTQFAYKYVTSQWLRSIIGITPTWHGNDLNFFWATNWSGITADQVVMFVTNFQARVTVPPTTALVTDDPIWAYSEQFATPGWQPYSYSPDATINTANQQPYTVTQTLQTTVPGDTIASYVETARIVLPFKDRLILLNTIENNALGATPFNTATPTITGITPASYLTSTNTQYVNRCRYSINGSPFAPNAFLQPKFVYKPNTGGGTATVVSSGAGYIDAPTEEAIVSAEFIKDRLIVYFERSTWELAYTGNQILPFVWQKINTELGAEGTFSVVPFDKVVLGIGNTGVHACSGANVERIDNKIPDEIFAIKNKNEGVKRVAGIRDFYTEMVYWTFPSNEKNQSEKFPNQILVYNYKTGSWALNNDCITTWGYFEQQTDQTWQVIQDTWNNADYTWDSGVIQAQFRQIIAGNQQGWVYIIAPDVSRNAGVMQITQITYTAGPPIQIRLTIIDHTLNSGDYIYIENASSVPNITGKIFQVTFITTNIVQLVLENTGVITPGGTYTGGGTAARVSNIQIQSKQLNPYVTRGRNLYLAQINFCVQRTSFGEITVYYSTSSSDLDMVEEATNSDCILGNSILETEAYATVPFEKTQVRLWHVVYFQAEGEFIQFLLQFSDDQIRTPVIALSDFQLEGMIWYTMPTSTRLQ